MKSGTQSSSVCFKLVTTIKEQILDGTFKYGQRLQTEKWICDTYHVSRTTVRKAIDTLIEEGFVERKANKGVYVTYSDLNTRFERPTSLYQEMERSGLKPSSKILSYQLIEADTKLAEIFHCSCKESIVKIDRLRYADKIPFALQVIYLIERFFPNFNPWQLTNHSFHSILLEEYNMEIAKTVQTVNVASANKNLSVLLDIPVRTPLLLTNSTMMLKTNDIVEYQETHVNTNIMPYSYIINQP